MHASVQELIALRDGELLAAERAQHLLSCAECSAELKRLRALRSQMQRLPDFPAPPANWDAINALRAQSPALASRLWRPTAAAAMVVLVALMVPRWFDGSAPQPGTMAANDTQVAALVARSQELESILHGLPKRPVVERAGTSAAIDALQSRIRLLDVQLATSQSAAPDNSQTQRLWSERVQLMKSLVGVRYAEAARNGYWTNNGNGAI